MSSSLNNVLALRGKASRKSGRDRSVGEATVRSYPPTITHLTLSELSELKRYWTLPAHDPRRRMHDMHPGETAMFIFHTPTCPLPTEGLEDLISTVAMKVFLITTGDDPHSYFRRRVEPSREEDEEGKGNLFPSIPRSNPSSTPSSQSTQDALQDVFEFSSFRTTFSNTTRENFFSPPSMILWRCGGAPADHYSKFYHYEPDLPPTELSAELQRIAVTSGIILTIKSITAAALIPCYSTLQPVYTPPHLASLVAKAGCPNGFTVMMIGSSDCPPCRRFLSNARELLKDLPASVSIYKADWYLATEARELVDPPAIPYFVIYKNSDILSTPPPTSSASSSWKPVATLQNSDVAAVRFFIHRHTKSLSFDDDF